MPFLSLFQISALTPCGLSTTGAPNGNITSSISQNKQNLKSFPLSLCQHKCDDLSVVSLPNYFSPCILRDGPT